MNVPLPTQTNQFVTQQIQMRFGELTMANIVLAAKLQVAEARIQELENASREHPTPAR